MTPVSPGRPRGFVRASTRWQLSLLATSLVAFLEVSTPYAVLAQDPNPARGTTAPGSSLDRELLRQVRRLELPPERWVFPDLEDRIHRRGGPPVVGKLLSLSSFATIELPRMQGGDSAVGELETTRLPRDEIEWIFLDGGSFPASPRLLPADEDAVLLASGEVLEGRVQIAADSITVGARSVGASEVRLVRLAGPESQTVTPADSDSSDDQVGDDLLRESWLERTCPSEETRAVCCGNPQSVAVGQRAIRG